MDKQKLCLLVVIGATADGTKELVALEDGAMGFWGAMSEVYPATRSARCWVHKTANVLNRLPKSVQKKAKGHIVDIYMAETKEKAEAAFGFFVKAYQAKYPKATEILVKDREELMAFYDFPAEHWVHSAIHYRRIEQRIRSNRRSLPCV